MKKLITWMLAIFSCLGAMPAAALDVTIPGLGNPILLSGFGTAGVAVSDKSYNYQRFVDHDGTLRRDSVFGVQLDAKLSNEFSITLQGKLAPSLRSDKDVTPALSWAFLSWRPSNDWLLRAGRLRIPLYMNSENMDVGTTFDFARLPAEVYTTAQTTDVDGLFLSKTWYADANEVTLAGYGGTTRTYYRWYRRDDIPSLLQSSGPYFVHVGQNAYGLVLTLQRGDDTYRISAHDTYTKIFDDQYDMRVSFPFVPVAPGEGYYQVSNQLPGPGVQMKSKIHALVYTAGADVQAGHGFRIIGEYVYRNVREVITGPDSMAGYIALLKQIKSWTPYVSVATLQSMPQTRRLYNNVNSNRIPNYNALTAMLNASQRAGADGIMAFDQTTVALGTSYQISPNSKVKAECARTQTGDMSFFVDAPKGGESGGKVIHVFSLSYNFAF